MPPSQGSVWPQEKLRGRAGGLHALHSYRSLSGPSWGPRGRDSKPNLVTAMRRRSYPEATCRKCKPTGSRARPAHSQAAPLALSTPLLGPPPPGGPPVATSASLCAPVSRLRHLLSSMVAEPMSPEVCCLQTLGDISSPHPGPTTPAVTPKPRGRGPWFPIHTDPGLRTRGVTSLILAFSRMQRE